MIEVKVFNNNTCNQLLNYRLDDGIRNLYNNKEHFDFDFKYLREPIKIDIDEKDALLGVKPADDLKNSIKIYEGLKRLDLVSANDKRIWVTLSHTLFYKYSIRRWNLDNTSSDNTIKDRFHFEGSSQRTRNQHSIARLWWASRITYDETLKDSYKLTKILWNKQDVYQNLIDRKYSTYPSTLKGFLNFYANNRNLSPTADLRRLFKGLNALGGVRVLSLLTEKEIITELEKLCDFYKIELTRESLINYD